MSEYRRIVREHDARPEVPPVDREIERAPSVVHALRRALRLGERVKTADRTALTRYVDSLTDLGIARQDVAFDLGFKRGLLRGRADIGRSSRDERRFAAEVIESVLASGLARHLAAGALLGVARALVLEAVGRRPRGRGRRQTRRRS
jgi:hypothetical protein